MNNGEQQRRVIAAARKRGDRQFTPSRSTTRRTIASVAASACPLFSAEASNRHTEGSRGYSMRTVAVSGTRQRIGDRRLDVVRRIRLWCERSGQRHEVVVHCHSRRRYADHKLA
jgi:hypothetical protein